MHVLKVSDLKVAFQSKLSTLIAVDGIDFEIHQGETIALVGESGCGKSLTAQALMRLLPHNARFGPNSRVLYHELDVLNISEHHMRAIRGQKIGMIFQDPMTALNPVLTIGEQLKEALNAHQKYANEQLANLLREVEIPEPERRLSQYPHELSGGQKQRVVIAMALAGEPQVLIADEPTTALDVTTQAQLLKLLKAIQIKRKMSLLLITHDLGLVQMMADRIYVMYAGQMVESATVQDFFNQPMHPYAQHLLAALPHYKHRNQPLSAIKGRVPVLDDLPSGCRFHPRCHHAFQLCSEQSPKLIAVEQNASTHRQARCHLYPKHEKPPPLTFSSTLAQSSIANTNVFDAEYLLSVCDLKVHFPMKRRNVFQPKIVHKAVDGVSFELKKGETLALVGESGSGKSTVCRVMLGLLAATSGQVMYQQRNITGLQGKALKAFRKDVQIIFQDPFSSMNPRMTVGEILAEGLEAQNMSVHAIAKRQIELLDQVNIPKGALTRYPHQFSGGQRQRICIARALATSPKIVICDEPTSALDVSVQAQILNLLKSLQDAYRLSYVFVTHNMSVVSYLADKVMVMRDGKIIERGTCEQLLTQPKHAYTKQLLAGVIQV